MIVNKRTIKKTLERILCVFIILVLIGSIRVLFWGPVGNKMPGSAPPHFHNATWQEFCDELYYILGCATAGSIIILPMSLAGESDKERKRMELERQEKEARNEQESDKNVSANEKA